MEQEFMNEIIAVQKDINNEIFLNYYKYQNQLLLVKNVIGANQIKKWEIIK